jgi:hypothetical protein
MLNRWSRLHLQSLVPTNPYWARMVGYGSFSLCVIHKEGLCPSSGDINRLMMMSVGFLRGGVAGVDNAAGAARARALPHLRHEPQRALRLAVLQGATREAASLRRRAVWQRIRKFFIKARNLSILKFYIVGGKSKSFMC